MTLVESSSDTLLSSEFEVNRSCADATDPEMDDVSAISPSPMKRDDENPSGPLNTCPLISGPATKLPSFAAAAAAAAAAACSCFRILNRFAKLGISNDVRKSSVGGRANSSST
jgi:hypothetical protein